MVSISLFFLKKDARITDILAQIQLKFCAKELEIVCLLWILVQILLKLELQIEQILGDLATECDTGI